MVWASPLVKKGREREHGWSPSTSILLRFLPLAQILLMKGGITIVPKGIFLVASTEKEGFPCKRFNVSVLTLLGGNPTKCAVMNLTVITVSSLMNK